MSIGGVWELAADTAERLLAAAGELPERSAVKAHIAVRVERMLDGETT